MKKVLFIFILVLSLAFTCSCTDISSITGIFTGTKNCTRHVDINGDYICDTCAQNIGVACTNHSDLDHDGVCDVINCNFTLAVEHVDEDHDGYCDLTLCSLVMAVEHSDADKNGRCDVCNRKVKVETDKEEDKEDEKDLEIFIKGLKAETLSGQLVNVEAYEKKLD